MRKPRISPLSHGAIGDGVTDDTAALNAASAAARSAGGYLSLPRGHIFEITSYVNLRNGIAGVLGDGGVVRTRSGTAEQSGLLLKGRYSGESHDVDGAVLDGVIFDANGVTTSRPIHGESPQNCLILNCQVARRAGTSASILLWALSATDAAPNGNVVRGCICDDTSTYGYGVAIQGYFTYAPYSTAPDRWPAEHSMGNNYVWGYNNVVEDCQFKNGHYSVSFLALRDSVIQRVKSVNPIRGVSMQNRSDGNQVRNVTVLDSLSSGIHIAYGSTNNVVEDNLIISTRAAGEAFLQSYVGCTGNQFRRNRTVAIGDAAGPKYHAYAGVHAGGCVFEDNIHIGKATCAYVAVESEWNSEITNPAHRNYNLGLTTSDGWANTGTNDVLVRGNRIEGVSAVPAIFLSAVESAVPQQPQLRTEVDGNVVVGTSYSRQFEIYEGASGSVDDLIVTDNTFDVGADSSKFTLPRGRAGHLAVDTGNNWPGGI